MAFVKMVCSGRARLRRIWRQRWQRGETSRPCLIPTMSGVQFSFWHHHPRPVVWQLQWHPLWDQGWSFQHLRIIVRFLWEEDPSENDMYARSMDDVFSKQVATPRPFPLTSYDLHLTVHFFVWRKTALYSPIHQDHSGTRWDGYSSLQETHALQPFRSLWTQTDQHCARLSVACFATGHGEPVHQVSFQLSYRASPPFFWTMGVHIILWMNNEHHHFVSECWQYYAFIGLES